MSVQTLPSDLPASHQEIIRLRRELEYYKEQLKLMRHRFFGRSSERRVPEGESRQVALFTSDPAPAPVPVEKEKITYERRKRQRVEGKLPEGTRFPEHLTREDEIINEGEGEIVFTKITERLAAHPSQFYVKRIIRNIRKTAEGSLRSPPVPSALLERTSVDISFLVYVMIAKYVWHLPLYRQEQILKAQGIQISRDTLIRYVIALADLLKPIYQALGDTLFESNHLFGDETPVMVAKLREGLRKYTESWFWTFLGDSGVFFVYTESRARKEIEPLLKTFSGKLQSDGYGVYATLSKHYPEITLVGCWAHSRRKFSDAERGGNAPEATEALRYIRALYKVEERIRAHKLGPPEILRLRQRFSRRILKLFHPWLKQKAQNPSLLPKGLFGVAIRYTLKRWDALLRYVDDPKLAIDSNSVERQIRNVAIGRKNWLHCASEEGADASAVLYSLIGSCKMAGIDPAEYLSDVLERISSHPAALVEQLIPVNWKTLREQELVATALPQVA